MPAKSPVDTLYWMRESELKHGRIAQLAGQLGLHPHHLVSTWDYLGTWFTRRAGLSVASISTVFRVRR